MGCCNVFFIRVSVDSSVRPDSELMLLFLPLLSCYLSVGLLAFVFQTKYHPYAFTPSFIIHVMYIDRV